MNQHTQYKGPGTETSIANGKQSLINNIANGTCVCQNVHHEHDL